MCEIASAVVAGSDGAVACVVTSQGRAVSMSLLIQVWKCSKRIWPSARFQRIGCQRSLRGRPRDDISQQKTGRGQFVRKPTNPSSPRANLSWCSGDTRATHAHHLCSCDECRRLKEKCEGGEPCRRCRHLRRSCEFKAPTAAGAEKRRSVPAQSYQELLDRSLCMETILKHHFSNLELDLASLRRACDALPPSPPDTIHETDSSQQDVQVIGEITEQSTTSPGIEDEKCTIDYIDGTVARELPARLTIQSLCF